MGQSLTDTEVSMNANFWAAGSALLAALVSGAAALYFLAERSHRRLALSFGLLSLSSLLAVLSRVASSEDASMMLTALSFAAALMGLMIILVFLFRQRVRS